jgi:hypothetical protein
MAAPAKNETLGSEGPKTETPLSPAKLSGAAQRKIPGNLPYVTASGTLKKVLDRLVEASRPDKFNTDFLENVLKLTGGSARATIPILKRLGFLSSDGVPTELYARFRTEGGRGAAALQALRAGFPEIFKRSEYAHSVDDNKLRDIIVEITGLKPNDSVATAIRGTFNVIKSHIPAGTDFAATEDEAPIVEELNGAAQSPQASLRIPSRQSSLGLVYNINVVLPETSDLRVLNAIFRSLKENLMQ